MTRTIYLKPIATGDACYLQDHHNRDGECLLTVTMMDGHSSVAHVIDSLPYTLGDACCLQDFDIDAADLASVTKWCAEQWQLAQADMPAVEDRDTDGDDSGRYLDCHILATWEV